MNCVSRTNSARVGHGFGLGHMTVASEFKWRKRVDFLRGPFKIGTGKIQITKPRHKARAGTTATAMTTTATALTAAKIERCCVPEDLTT